MAQEVGSLDDVDGLRVWERGDTEPTWRPCSGGTRCLPPPYTKMSVHITQFKVQKLSQGTRESLQA